MHDAPKAMHGLGRFNLFNGLLQSLLLLGQWPLLVVTAGAVEYLTDHSEWKVLCEHRYHRTFLAKGTQQCRGFFAISSSIVSRPTSRSNSAIRSCSALRFWSCSNTSGARSRNSVFQRASTCGLSWCCRHSSAVLCAPLIRSSTTCVLNSAVNVRRCVIVYPFLGSSIPPGFHFARCPIPGGHYTIQSTLTGYVLRFSR